MLYCGYQLESPICGDCIILDKREMQHMELIDPKKITSDGLVSFISVQRYVSYCCITHSLQSEVKNVSQSIGYNPSWGQNVKSHKISDFIMFCSLISSSNGNHLSRHHGIPSLILCK